MAATNVDRGPGVPFPPPFLFAGGFLVAWLLQRRLPFDVDRDGAGFVQSTIGLAALVAGLAFMASGIGTFGRHRTTLIPNRPARTLVRTGPYRFTRNPMYVGLTAAYIGLTLLINWAWPLVLLPVVLVLLTTLVIRREEQYLRAAFGAEYDAYCGQVRRWI
jgi:protein-S-isoprenylcysteine O-methyltransferase Ste14